MKTGLIVIQVFLIVVMMTSASEAFANDKIDSKVIVDGGWGKATSQFEPQNVRSLQKSFHWFGTHNQK